MWAVGGSWDGQNLGSWASQHFADSFVFLRSSLNSPLTPGETPQMSHFWHPPFNEPFDIMSVVLLSRSRARKQSEGWYWATWVSSAGFLEKNHGKLILLLTFVQLTQYLTHDKLYSGVRDTQEFITKVIWSCRPGFTAGDSQMADKGFGKGRSRGSALGHLLHFQLCLKSPCQSSADTNRNQKRLHSYKALFSTVSFFLVAWQSLCFVQG